LIDGREGNPCNIKKKETHRAKKPREREREREIEKTE
jgi:hypothetical protein